MCHCSEGDCSPRSLFLPVWQSIGRLFAEFCIDDFGYALLGKHLELSLGTSETLFRKWEMYLWLCFHGILLLLVARLSEVSAEALILFASEGQDRGMQFGCCYLLKVCSFRTEAPCGNAALPFTVLLAQGQQVRDPVTDIRWPCGPVTGSEGHGLVLLWSCVGSIALHKAECLSFVSGLEHVCFPLPLPGERTRQ